MPKYSLALPVKVKARVRFCGGRGEGVAGGARGGAGGSGTPLPMAAAKGSSRKEAANGSSYAEGSVVRTSSRRRKTPLQRGQVTLVPGCGSTDAGSSFE